MPTKTEPRKLRSDLTPQEKGKAERIGSLTFKSHRKVDRRVEKFVPSKEQH
jgi:hypothetical protein